MLRRWVVLLVAAVSCGLASATLAGAATTTIAEAAPVVHDASVTTGDAIQGLGDLNNALSQPGGSQQWSASGSAMARGTATARSVATEGAGAAERTVVMGRNMPGRVVPYAEKNGYDFYGGSPKWIPRGLQRVTPKTLDKVDLWFNKRWIGNEMSGGSRIIGSPRFRVGSWVAGSSRVGRRRAGSGRGGVGSSRDRTQRA